MGSWNLKIIELQDMRLSVRILSVIDIKQKDSLLLLLQTFHRPTIPTRKHYLN